MTPGKTPRHRSRPLQARTIWHPLFVRTLQRALPRRYFIIEPEHPLSQEPLRADIVVVRRRRAPLSFRPAVLTDVVALLGEHTLIELKGPTDRLDWTDLCKLSVYSGLYRIERRLPLLRSLRRIMVAPLLSRSFRDEVRRRRGALSALGPGTWEVEGLEHVTYVIETERASDQMIHFFSRPFLREPAAAVAAMSEAERVLVGELFGEIQQFRQDPHVELRYPDFEEAAMSMQKLVDRILEIAPELRFKGMTPEDRMRGLASEDRLRGLAPEERLRGLAPEDFVKGLSPEARDKLRLLLEEDHAAAKPQRKRRPAGRKPRSSK